MKKTTSKTTGTDEVCTEKCTKKCSIDKLTLSFNSEDMNKVVEKINEIIEKNDSI